MTMSCRAARLYDNGEALFIAIAAFMSGGANWFDGGDFITFCEGFVDESYVTSAGNKLEEYEMR